MADDFFDSLTGTLATVGGALGALGAGGPDAATQFLRDVGARSDLQLSREWEAFSKQQDNMFRLQELKDTRAHERTKLNEARRHDERMLKLADTYAQATALKVVEAEKETREDVQLHEKETAATTMSFQAGQQTERLGATAQIEANRIAARKQEQAREHAWLNDQAKQKQAWLVIGAERGYAVSREDQAIAHAQAKEIQELKFKLASATGKEAEILRHKHAMAEGAARDVTRKLIAKMNAATSTGGATLQTAKALMNEKMANNAVFRATILDTPGLSPQAQKAAVQGNFDLLTTELWEKVGPQGWVNWVKNVGARSASAAAQRGELGSKYGYSDNDVGNMTDDQVAVAHAQEERTSLTIQNRMASNTAHANQVYNVAVGILKDGSVDPDKLRDNGDDSLKQLRALRANNDAWMHEGGAENNPYFRAIMGETGHTVPGLIPGDDDWVDDIKYGGSGAAWIQHDELLTKQITDLDNHLTNSRAGTFAQKLGKALSDGEGIADLLVESRLTPGAIQTVLDDKQTDANLLAPMRQSLAMFRAIRPAVIASAAHDSDLYNALPKPVHEFIDFLRYQGDDGDLPDINPKDMIRSLANPDLPETRRNLYTQTLKMLQNVPVEDITQNLTKVKLKREQRQSLADVLKQSLMPDQSSFFDPDEHPDVVDKLISDNSSIQNVKDMYNPNGPTVAVMVLDTRRLYADENFHNVVATGIAAPPADLSDLDLIDQKTIMREAVALRMAFLENSSDSTMAKDFLDLPEGEKRAYFESVGAKAGALLGSQAFDYTDVEDKSFRVKADDAVPVDAELQAGTAISRNDARTGRLIAASGGFQEAVTMPAGEVWRAFPAENFSDDKDPIVNNPEGLMDHVKRVFPEVYFEFTGPVAPGVVTSYNVPSEFFANLDVDALQRAERGSPTNRGLISAIRILKGRLGADAGGALAASFNAGNMQLGHDLMGLGGEWTPGQYERADITADAVSPHTPMTGRYEMKIRDIDARIQKIKTMLAHKGGGFGALLDLDPGAAIELGIYDRATLEADLGTLNLRRADLVTYRNASKSVFIKEGLRLFADATIGSEGGSWLSQGDAGEGGEGRGLIPSKRKRWDPTVLLRKALAGVGYVAGDEANMPANIRGQTAIEAWKATQVAIAKTIDAQMEAVTAAHEQAKALRVAGDPGTPYYVFPAVMRMLDVFGKTKGARLWRATGDEGDASIKMMENIYRQIAIDAEELANNPEFRAMKSADFGTGMKRLLGHHYTSSQPAKIKGEEEEVAGQKKTMISEFDLLNSSRQYNYKAYIYLAALIREGRYRTP